MISRFLVAAVLPAVAFAQMPGVPVLQNAWASPGLAVAGNIAGGDSASVYGIAGGWAPGGARFLLSGGLGLQSPTGGGSRVVYGARVAIPLKSMMGGALGFAGFAGVGGGGASDSLEARTLLPVGVAIGYRRSLGAVRGVSAYASPNYLFVRGDSVSTGLVRLGLGVDVGITRRIGITVGGDFGQQAARGEPGPRSSLFGLGVSFLFGR